MRGRTGLLILALGVALTGFAGPASAAAPSAPAPVVVGNRLVDARTNATWVPHGANWPSFEYACSQGWAYSQADDTSAAAAAMASWGINAVRVPLNSNCWLGLDPSDYGTATGYRNAVASWVSILNSHGIVAILDLHWSAPTGQHALGQWPMADSNSIPFWTSVATAYAGNPSVLFDAFNEPYSIWDGATNSYSFQLSWTCWQRGGCTAPLVTPDQVPVGCYNAATGACTYTVVGMSQLVAAIRSGGAAQPIMLGGLNYSNNLTGWLAHKPSDSQLVASWHNYPGQDSCGYTTACWDAATLSVAASVPIVTGEFGETDGGSSAMTAYMSWADAHGIGYLPWAWWNADDVSGDAALYALFQGTDFTPHAPAGTSYKAHLAGLSGPPVHLFHTLPAPVTITQLGAASAPVTPATPTPDATAVSATQLADLDSSSQRILRISAR